MVSRQNPDVRRGDVVTLRTNLLRSVFSLVGRSLQEEVKLLSQVDCIHPRCRTRDRLNELVPPVHFALVRLKLNVEEEGHEEHGVLSTVGLDRTAINSRYLTFAVSC